MEEELLTSSVPRALEMKTKILGFELPDLLLIFMNMAITNLVFGGTSLRYPLVWGTTLAIALFLYFIKRGKPDNYLQHLGEFYTKPAMRSAGEADLLYRKFKRKEIDNE
ncbi:MAG: hypothetical protein A2504_13035 [Bdellovibrionales bacterium RIFOXYD12_FULL_39_22]|nr:MAG: hypothetical protein A2385_00835 [Bdellovibrionales bacterium RIFOXYB1_FULL_39_21]OFZ43553.1 MAG: hypothetical protein A2485_12505 [Bdellovibrionales bacterium RIFOXYC12_FULL_39_17]OFZ44572.1 MAG: hypothetical protein A2404_10195 [Bdellovibrionales bacterium RIFOXYC1_FULL_39_130]OFZ71256.1 MAG: hypothetical protein A2451_12020 [Bdellovibrionales bacterium RIFOXYC2_FULL_39_8]OFZ76331.1 MAG: hypothetical protein A2560_06815 [Bdellovibrionales bacterium RIFOXYD1_FULL_39_84]OFZ94597.1 MAG: